MKDNRRNRQPQRGGFTLLEVMIVLLILVTMAGLGVFAFRGQLEQGRKRTAFTYVKELAGYVEMYELDMGRPPTTEQGLGALVRCPADVLNPGKYAPGGYIKSTAVSRDPWGNEYQYVCPGKDGTAFSIWSYGPDGMDGTDDDIGSWSAGLDE